MTSKVAVLEFEGSVQKSFERALELIGTLDDINTRERSVVIKVGVFDPLDENHATVNVVDAIIRSFSKTPQIFLVESDNYRGTGSERLQIWRELFSERVVPFNLSDDTHGKRFKLAGEEVQLSHILLKPNVMVSAHVLRGYERGSVLKNLFGLVPDPKKARFHKKLDKLLPDIYEAIGGIDLAVIDGTYVYSGPGGRPAAGLKEANYRVKMNTLLVGRDAIAVETVGAVLAGLKPEKMPVLQEAVKRGLGEGNLENIQIFGSSFDDVKDRFSVAVKGLKQKRV